LKIRDECRSDDLEVEIVTMYFIETTHTQNPQDFCGGLHLLNKALNFKNCEPAKHKPKKSVGQELFDQRENRQVGESDPTIL